MQVQEFAKMKKPAKYTSKEFNEYWKPLCDALNAKRESEKGPIIEKRALELKSKVSGAL